jgi:TorA maturation chaperone TorD
LKSNDWEWSLTALAEGQSGQLVSLAAEEQLRAQLYRLLASLLSDAPSNQLLQRCAALNGDASRLGMAIGVLARVAANTQAQTARVEYHDLFIGVGRGELVPYASYYLTGFLQEKPLAKLRQDLAGLGVIRTAQTSDPEDHAAAILEVMAGLIDGTYGAPVALDVQKLFFERHLQAWLPIFLRDLETAQASVFYSALGSVGRAYLEIEISAFEMV